MRILVSLMTGILSTFSCCAAISACNSLIYSYANLPKLSNGITITTPCTLTINNIPGKQFGSVSYNVNFSGTAYHEATPSHGLNTTELSLSGGQFCLPSNAACTISSAQIFKTWYNNNGVALVDFQCTSTDCALTIKNSPTESAQTSTKFTTLTITAQSQSSFNSKEKKEINYKK